MTNNTDTLPETGLLRLPEVLVRFPISRSAWYAGIKTGKYPKGIKLSERTVAWSAEDIRQLISEVSK